MSARDFVHLHTHSHYSLLEALPKMPELVAAAARDGQMALALTDNGNLYGAIEFYKECKESSIKPILGVDFYVAPRTRAQKEHRIDEHTSRLVLLAKDLTGYRNLLRLVSRSHLEGFYYRPRIDRELIEAHREGLVAMLPSFGGEHARLLREGNTERAKESLDWHKKIYGEDLFLEITRHPEIEGHEKEMQGIISLARESGVDLVAAHDTYYLKKEDALARELVRKIRSANVLNRDFEQGAPDFSFIPRARMQELFADIPEALENSARIAEKCDLKLKLGLWVFPDFPIPAGSTANDELRLLAEKGFKERGIAETKENKERVDYELSIIGSKGYSPYFLVVADLLHHAREKGILTNTRGSAAGSLVSYLSGITTVDPLEYQLPFERFLNPERPSPPDIDMDLADNRRDELIAYVREKYGEEKVAQIGTFGTMMARAAVRDVARALGHPYSLGDTIAKLIPFGKQGFPVTIAGALEEVPELAELYKKNADVRECLDLAQKIEGNARHVGVHAAGVVIAPSAVTDFSPIQIDPKGNHIITQYDMYAIEEAGLLKFDFLGLTNLSVLADSVARVRERLSVDVDLDHLKLDDAKTFEMLSRGETLGVFQLSGGGMTAYLVDLKPTSIHDINAMVALYRPGPMAFIPAYIERKKDPKKVKYLDPRMEAILKNSYGVITYQDDVLELAIKIAGYTWLEADKFRKAMGKKIPKEMAAQKEKFTRGCVANGMKKESVQRLWEQIETFAAYGFNKAHAASYGNLAYKTAYMKANFPVDYMAAVLTADAGDVDKIAEVVAECKRMGISVLPPSVNESMGNFTVIHPERTRGVDDPSTSSGQAHSIRFGLYSIKNFGVGVADSIIAGRESGGPFTDIADFLSRIPDKNLNKKSLESLIQAGALDALGERGALLVNIELLLDFHREHVKAPTNLMSLFGTSSTKATLKLPEAPVAGLDERLKWEKDLLGLYISGHPLDKHKEKFKDAKKSIKHAKEHLRGVETVIAGFIESARINQTKNGEKIGFLKLADFSDSIEIVVFPRTFKEYETIMTPGSCVAIKGKISERNGETSFVVERAKAL
ncbi:DNA polymerase III subunit alpha [Candidatus Kaiserbacteria bacterium RIFCSPHIGHO2_01_FULL_54_36b]|uniref:DNA polymerase III subunit alpha n=2 Tax=Candidatus Kaiseribacteriota TaxID=1752734 RepID=A0A1F6CR29_9BACT|nr:MAG: DNA polymerase III subunit alpha [Candidatus Kaiserbacteria bacterium RIFCSPHIGHO2_01_FULL_54_36b]